MKLTPVFQQGSFPLVKDYQATSILIDNADAKIVSIVANAIASDIELVTAAKPLVETNIKNNNSYLIIAGTIGKSAAIDEMVKTNKLDVSKIRNKWESFTITTINSPIKGIQQALVIAGSDPRGTAYGLFELSKAAGVAPWVWWADVVPLKQKMLFVSPGTFTSKEPSVKYRGFFLNDEDWGLQPWAAKTFEPETGDIGPKTYAKIFELMLRLRANLIWPAMHDCTKAFFTIPGNAKVAEDYGILLGTSHAEPMLRNNVGEWNEKTMGHYNYINNKETVYKYWEERVTESKDINAIYTLGMRGIHDSKMEGIADTKEAVPLLETIFKDQREMLANHVNKNVSDIPQVFTAYKEVLEIYDNGLKLPDDVTIVWPDDNYGYIQRLNNEEEMARSGGSGVYYHASYWGRPHDYLWISTTHPSLIQQELMKAFENRSNRLWVLNVGDIKPLEYNIELFSDMAYNAEPFKDYGYARKHLLKWSTDLFGKEAGPKIQSVLWEFYNLSFERRPEFMGWSQTEPTTKTNHTAYNHFFYGDEAQKRIDRFQVLENKMKTLRGRMLPKDKNAFYQLVYYPVVVASFMNKKFLYRDKSYYYAKQNRLSALDYQKLSKDAYDSIILETNYFNNQLSGGKWKNMLSMKPRNLPVFSEPDFPPIEVSESEGWSIAPEGMVTKDSSLLKNNDVFTLPSFDNLNKQNYFIDVFLNNSKALNWTATPSASWIKLTQSSGQLKPAFGDKEVRLYVTVDWSKFSGNKTNSGHITFSSAGKQIFVAVTAKRLSVTGNLKGYVENNGYVSIKAVHFSRVQKGSGNWQLLPGIGYAGEGLATGKVAQKDTMNIRDTAWLRKNSSFAEYDFYTFSAASGALTIFTLPTHPLNNAFSMRYAISVNDGPLQMVDFRTYGRSEEWKQNVLRNRAERKIQLSFLKPGNHKLRIYSVDPGVILDEILLDLGGLKKAYSGIQETKTN